VQPFTKFKKLIKLIVVIILMFNIVTAAFVMLVLKIKLIIVNIRVSLWSAHWKRNV